MMDVEENGVAFVNISGEVSRDSTAGRPHRSITVRRSIECHDDRVAKAVAGEVSYQYPYVGVDVEGCRVILSVSAVVESNTMPDTGGLDEAYQVASGLREKAHDMLWMRPMFGGGDE